jgi:hypothetical protein
MPSIDAPVHQKAMTLGDLWRCVVHPAFRLGFLDARAGHPLDHDRILRRIMAETPKGALQRLGWTTNQLFDGPDMFGVESDAAARAAQTVALAQYRYEEGRALFLEYGLRCKAWGHPDFPPAEVRNYLYARVAEMNATQPRLEDDDGSENCAQPPEVRTG